MGLYQYEPLSIGRSSDVYSYPFWSNLFGWIMAGSSCICIPIVAVYYLITAKGTLVEVVSIIKTHIDNFFTNSVFL